MTTSTATLTVQLLPAGLMLVNGTKMHSRAYMPDPLESLRDIATLYEQGYKMRSISSKYRISKTTVLQIIRLLGIKERSWGGCQVSRKRKQGAL